MIFRFILPVSKYLEDLINDSLKDYLSSLMEIFIIVFAFFLIFLLVSLVVSVKIMISHMKTVVIRTKILIKIIPSDALLGIAKEMKKEKK